MRGASGEDGFGSGGRPARAVDAFPLGGEEHSAPRGTKSARIDGALIRCR